MIVRALRFLTVGIFKQVALYLPILSCLQFKNTCEDLLCHQVLRLFVSQGSGASINDSVIVSELVHVPFLVVLLNSFICLALTGIKPSEFVCHLRMTANLLSPTNFLTYGYLSLWINLNYRNRIFTWRRQQAKVGGKTHWELHRFGPRRLQSHQCYGSFGLIVFNGGSWPKSEEFLLCQYVNRSAGCSITGGGRRKESPGVGANTYLKLVFVSVGERTR